MKQTSLITRPIIVVEQPDSSHHLDATNEETEEFDIEDMLTKVEAQCRKLEREWIAARYVLYFTSTIV